MALADATAFPYGLRVLVVDDDPTWLKILEKMLRKCSYEVMSIDGETSRVMKGVQHGACDYLLKPVRMKELRNIWQHVYRKKMHEVKEIEGHDNFDDIQMLRNGCEALEERGLFIRSESDTMRKRKDVDKDHADQELSDGTTVKKARVVWSVDLHQKFVNAVNQIGFDKVGPKKILDLMNVPGLTRENVASHLQKYRLYLSRLQKQNEERIMGATRQDFSHKGPSDNLNLRSSFNEQTGGVLSFERMPVNQDRKPSETMILDCQSWRGNEAPKQFMQYPKRNHERCDLLGDYSCLPKPDLEQTIAPSHLYVPPPVSSVSCSMEGDTRDSSDVKPGLLGCMKPLSPAINCTVDSVSVQLSDRVTSTDGDLKVFQCARVAQHQRLLFRSDKEPSHFAYFRRG
ncbi:hypothetical protein PR202_ga08591 [Eleusine coracana subsp. coracana]|uniref:Two-component response regulator n=1 Tax=Eleusine coracana subsp. coracana TaxID=191504 RepID=A0AAV5C1M5_ELECO|nr:hypothetical protein PR202_ga08591 [Eleusine coracana subsp. coracana]